jgi:hypothetical protein
MKRTTHIALAIALTFLAGLFCGAQAQTKPTTLQGIEVSSGLEGGERGVTYGVSFLGKTTGVLPGSFFMSLNHTSFLSPDSPINTINGGTWSLAVYQYNRYLGAIYGRVAEGSMNWKAPDTVAAVNITLMVDGGTRIFTGVSGKGTFTGTLNRMVDDKPAMNGTLNLQF